MKHDCSAQLQHALECYNVTTEEGDEDPRNISIPKLEWLLEVAWPDAKIPDIS